MYIDARANGAAGLTSDSVVLPPMAKTALVVATPLEPTKADVEVPPVFRTPLAAAADCPTKDDVDRPLLCRTPCAADALAKVAVDVPPVARTPCTADALAKVAVELP